MREKYLILIRFCTTQFKRYIDFMFVNLTYCINLLKLKKCDYSDTCDFCDRPSGGSWEYVSEGRIVYHVCSSCLPSLAKTVTDVPQEALPF